LRSFSIEGRSALPFAGKEFAADLESVRQLELVSNKLLNGGPFFLFAGMALDFAQIILRNVNRDFHTLNVVISENTSTNFRLALSRG